MKNRCFIVMLPVMLVTACSVRKAVVSYQFPKEMAEPVKAEYVKMWEKGRILYDINCAKCHNTIVKRREVVPDFTQEQLKGYELRVMNPQHERTMPDEKVTAEELVLISTFLMYKTRN